MKMDETVPGKMESTAATVRAAKPQKWEGDMKNRDADSPERSKPMETPHVTSRGHDVLRSRKDDVYEARPGNAEVSEFSATHEELEALVAYWARVGVESRFHMFGTHSRDGGWKSRYDYAVCRLRRIAPLIGLKVVYEALDTGFNEFESTLPRRWVRLYYERGTEDSEEIRNEVEAAMEAREDRDPRLGTRDYS